MSKKQYIDSTSGFAKVTVSFLEVPVSRIIACGVFDVYQLGLGVHGGT